jgi:hypothetical protein
MAGLLRRLFGRDGDENTQYEPGKCYICGVDTGYRCSVCYRYICQQHTDPGTTVCVNCAEERRQEMLR